MANEAMEPFIRLRERVAEALDGVGLDFMTWALVDPGRPGETPSTQLVATIRPDAFQSPEEREMDKTFEEIALEEKRREREQEAARIVQENLKVSRKGIFPEDGAPGA